MSTCSSSQTACGCGQIQQKSIPHGPWVTGSRITPWGLVPRISTRLGFIDTVTRWKARWGIGRMALLVEPGLYAVGNPGAESVVLVSANYRVSFDALRAELGGLNVWVLVLDTHGINVWCAAGKGTFGTEELVRRIESTRLKDIVTHRTVIVPQLGAPGVARHAVKGMSGFKVVFGPVRARDIKAFLDSGMRATPAMRRVDFNLAERLAVVPKELVMAAPYILLFVGIVAAWQWFFGDLSIRAIVLAILPSAGALLMGAVVVPALLPWLPPRSFALKGWLAGLVWTSGFARKLAGFAALDQVCARSSPANMGRLRNHAFQISAGSQSP